MTSRSRNIRIFVSSTFKDMQAERQAFEEARKQAEAMWVQDNPRMHYAIEQINAAL